MNLEDVARRAKVSTATVSRVLNGADIVRASTRARVMKAVAELNYHPNLHARSLAGVRSKTLGVIVSNLENPFFFDVYRSLENDCRSNGYEVLVANTDYRSEQLVASIRLMIGRRVAGLAVIVSEMESALIQELTESQIPAVFYDVGPSRPNVANIRVNYKRGVDQVVEHLSGLGHRKFAFIGHHATLSPINERCLALRDALELLTPDAELRAAAGADSLEGGQLAARALLTSGYVPTAIVCVNDLMAAGVLRELRERGLRVPGDVSVAGFDNVCLSEFCYPALTTVHIPRDTIGHIVFSILAPGHNANDGHVGHGNAGEEILLDPELVIRDSTGPAKSGPTSRRSKSEAHIALRPA